MFDERKLNRKKAEQHEGAPEKNEVIDGTTTLGMFTRIVKSRFFRKARTVMGTLALTTGLAFPPNVAEGIHIAQEQQRSEEEHKAEDAAPEIEGKTHDEYQEERREESADILNQYLNTRNGAEIIGQCNPTAFFEFNNDTKDSSKPLLIHVGQNHGLSDPLSHEEETYLSQEMSRRILASLIENNNTEKTLPIVVEWQSVLSEEEQRLDDEEKNDILLKSYLEKDLFHALVLQSEKERVFDPCKSKSASVFNFSHSVLGLIAYFNLPERERKIVRDSDVYFGFPTDRLLTKIKGMLFTDKEAEIKFEGYLRNIRRHSKDIKIDVVPDYNQISGFSLIDSKLAGVDLTPAVDYLFTQLKEIERKEGFRIIMGDVPIDENESTATNTEDGSWESEVEEYDSIHTARDAVMSSNAMRAAREFGTDVVVVFLGGGHDLRNDGMREEMNVLEIQTAPSHVRDGVMRHGVTHSKFIETEFSNSAVNKESSMEERVRGVKLWVQRHGGEATVRELFNDGQFHDRLLVDVGAFKEVFGYSEGDVFSIVKKGMDAEPHWYAHNQSYVIDSVIGHISEEDFHALRRMLFVLEQ